MPDYFSASDNIDKLLTSRNLALQDEPVTREDIELITGSSPDSLKWLAEFAVAKEGRHNETLLTALTATCMDRLVAGDIPKADQRLLQETVELCFPT